MRLHCIYCGETLPVKQILYVKADRDEQASRLEFELRHDVECGPKSIGLILELPQPTLGPHGVALVAGDHR